MSNTNTERHCAETPPPSKGGERRGFSLVEVLLAVIILSVALLGLSASASYGLKQTTRAKSDLRYSADLQQVADSLVNRGFGNVASGSTTVRGRSISWVVTNPTVRSQLVTIVVARRNNQDSQLVASDTLSLYLATPNPVPGT